MGSQHAMVADIRVGLLVEHLGGRETDDVFDTRLRTIGMALYPGHPGRVASADIRHVLVDWVGLEEEPASFIVGYDSSRLDPDSTYPGLGLLAVEAFERRRATIAEVLRSGRDLSRWIPPWPAPR